MAVVGRILQIQERDSLLQKREILHETIQKVEQKKETNMQNNKQIERNIK